MTRTLAACAAILAATLIAIPGSAGAADQTVGVRTSGSAKVKVSKAPRATRYGHRYDGPRPVVEPCCEPYYAYGYLPYNFYPYRYAYYPQPYFRRPPNGVGPFGWSAPTGYGW